MNVPCFHDRFVLLVAILAAWGLASSALAQPPVAAPPPPESNSPRAPRAKPQVIYHLPPASNYAAALHSQAKTQRDALPADSTRPSSPQVPRTSANEPAKAPPDLAGPRPRTNSFPAASERAAKHRPHSSGPTLRSHPAGKGHGHGNGHGNKAHRK
ncbi:MAG: hypothetical protein WAO00_04015 [Chthoniobacterales bacterium]